MVVFCDHNASLCQCLSMLQGLHDWVPKKVFGMSFSFRLVIEFVNLKSYLKSTVSYLTVNLSRKAHLLVSCCLEFIISFVFALSS